MLLKSFYAFSLLNLQKAELSQVRFSDFIHSQERCVNAQYYKKYWYLFRRLNNFVSEKLEVQYFNTYGLCQVRFSRDCKVSTTFCVKGKEQLEHTSISGERNGNPFQYSCLENFMDRGAWQAPVHGVVKCWTCLSD